MTYYFVGGEDHDFTRIGATSVDTATTAARRTGNARCVLKVGVSAAATDGWQGAFSSAQSSVWLTARNYISTTSFTASHEFMAFLDGATRRLSIRMATGSLYQLVKRTASGTVTTLASSSAALSASALQKIDIKINYAVAGTFEMYVNGALILSYSGDLTTDSASSLSGFVLGTTGNGATTNVFWSEVIAASEDTRALSLVTMAPTANGNAFAWTGSYTDVAEVTLDDATIAASAADGNLAQATVSSAGITGNPAIRAVCISARAQKGGTGPQNLQMNVRTGGNDYFGSTQALPAALGRVATVFEINPATSGPFAYTDLTAAGFNIGVKSVA